MHFLAFLKDPKTFKAQLGKVDVHQVYIHPNHLPGNNPYPLPHPIAIRQDNPQRM